MALAALRSAMLRSLRVWTAFATRALRTLLVRAPLRTGVMCATLIWVALRTRGTYGIIILAAL